MGKAFFSLVILLSVSVAAPAALAREGCEASLLSGLNRPVVTEKSHAISDFEGLYVAIVEATVELSSLEGDRQYAKLKELLNLKAQFLNHIPGILGIVMEPGETYGLSLVQLNDMILSIGIPPEVFGDSGQWVAQKSLATQKAFALQAAGLGSPAQAPIEIVSSPIGFDVGIDHQSLGEPPLPEGVHRSIGFKDFEFRADAPPMRAGGRIWVTPSLSQQSLSIIDMQTEKGWTVSIEMASVMKITDGYEVIAVTYNSDIGEWIIVRENLANPSGVIGFQARRN